MRNPKIRGNNRRLRNIDHWIEQSRAIDLSHLQKNGSISTRIGVLPWINSDLDERIKHPNGKLKKAIVAGMIAIYCDWKEKLEKSGKPFYLKIWLNEPRFGQSQVVGAIGEKITYYENLFPGTESGKPDSITQNFAESFIWKINSDNAIYWQEQFQDSPELYDSLKTYAKEMKFYRQLLSNKVKNTRSEFSGQTAFLVKKGLVFVGGIVS